MNAAFQTALNNLESNLQTLLESVSSYNPSPAAAQALVQADDELTATLEKLDEHQQSHRQIQSLRETSAALDEQLSELLTTLSETRKQLVSVPSTRFEAEPRQVSYLDLLSYASKISKFSRPPNPAAFRKLANAAAPKAADEAKLPLGLLEEDLSGLDPSGTMPFTPWPNEVVMKQGALAMVGPQGLPEDMVPEEERKAAAEEARKRVEEKQGGATNGKLDDGEAGREAEKARRGSYMPQGQREKQPAMNLSLDLWDAEDDED